MTRLAEYDETPGTAVIGGICAKQALAGEESVGNVQDGAGDAVIPSNIAVYVLSCCELGTGK